MARKKADDVKKEVREDRKEEVEEAEGAYEDRVGESRMYDLNVTAEERGYGDEETLAPENELKDDPAGELLNEPDAEDAEESDKDDEDSK